MTNPPLDDATLQSWEEDALFLKDNCDQNTALPESSEKVILLISMLRESREEISHLREAIRVKDEALEIYAKPDSVLSGSDYQMYGTSSSRQAFDDNGHEAREALAWKPREQCEGNRAMSDEERAAQWKPGEK